MLAGRLGLLAGGHRVGYKLVTLLSLIRVGNLLVTLLGRLVAPNPNYSLEQGQPHVGLPVPSVQGRSQVTHPGHRTLTLTCPRPVHHPELTRFVPGDLPPVCVGSLCLSLPWFFILVEKGEGSARRRRRCLTPRLPGSVPLDHHTRRCAPTFTPPQRGGGGSSPLVALTWCVDVPGDASPRPAGGPPSTPKSPLV